MSNGVKTGIFVAILVGVLVIFQLMYVLQDPPPDMPGGPQHTLNFNTANELIGAGDQSAWATKDKDGKPLSLKKKAVERRVNLYCATCHGAPSGLNDEEFAALTNCPVPHKCLPNHETHPPKETCIKCHRMPKGGGAVPSAQPQPTAAPTPAAQPDHGKLKDGGAAASPPAAAQGDVGKGAASKDGGAGSAAAAGAPTPAAAAPTPAPTNPPAAKDEGGW